jgi:hypothetical protein
VNAQVYRDEGSRPVGHELQILPPQDCARTRQILRSQSRRRLRPAAGFFNLHHKFRDEILQLRLDLAAPSLSFSSRSAFYLELGPSTVELRSLFWRWVVVGVLGVGVVV